jgi:hypothetical protein
MGSAHLVLAQFGRKVPGRPTARRTHAPCSLLFRKPDRPAGIREYHRIGRRFQASPRVARASNMDCSTGTRSSSEPGCIRNGGKSGPGNVGRISGQRHSEKSGYGWLGRQDSNLGMVESKSTALPLGDAPAGGRTIVISPEGRYCGLTPPQYGRPSAAPGAAFANPARPIYKVRSMSRRATMTVKKTATPGGTEEACAR